MSDYQLQEEVIADALHYRECLDPQPPLTEIARRFGVPYQRLLRRSKGLNSRSTRLQTNLKLTPEQEHALVIWLKRCDDCGVSARLSSLSASANSILARDYEGPGSPPQVSHMWASRWLQRHKEWKKRPSRPIDAARAAAHDPNAIQGWYTRYKQVIDTYGLQPQDIWNMDETGFRIGITRSQTVLTLQDRRNWTPAANNRESVTVVEAVSAAGNYTPPMVIVTGVRHQAAWFQSLHDDTKVATSESGYSNDVLSFEWLQHWNKHSNRSQLGAYRLLLMDGYGSHCTAEFIQYCNNNAIIPFSLPPHMSHLMQPLDVAVFQPYKHWHSEALDAATRTGCVDFNKVEFLAAFEAFRKQALKKGTIRSGFEKTGIWPYNPQAVLDKVQVEWALLRQQQEPRILDDPMPTATPKTPMSLKRAQKHFIDNQYARDEHETEALQVIFRGARIQALAGAEAIDELRRTTVASTARLQRAASKRQYLQNGGVLTATEAREIVQRRHEDDIQKAEKVIARAKSAILSKRKRLIRLAAAWIQQSSNYKAEFKAFRRQYEAQWLLIIEQIENR